MTATVWPRSSRLRGQRRADASTPHDDDVHGCLPRAPARCAPVGDARAPDAVGTTLHRDQRFRCDVHRWRARRTPAWSSHPSVGIRRRRQAGAARAQAAQHPAGGDACCPSGSPSRSSPATRSRRSRYAPDEILLTLSVGGSGRRTRASWKIAICVAVVMLDGHRVVPAERPRLPERWRRLRGRDRQPRQDGRADRRPAPCSSTTS